MPDHNDPWQVEARAAWEADPDTAMTWYGLPCYHGYYGGCELCESYGHRPLEDG